MSFELEFFDDPAGFLAAAAGFLDADPVRSTVVATVTARMQRGGDEIRPAEAPVPWWLLVRDHSGTVVGAGMRTAPFPPYPPYLLAMPDEAALVLARVLHARGEGVDAVNGALPAARLCAEETARLTGRRAEFGEQMRLHEVTAVIDPPAPEGGLRIAGMGDVDLVRAWFDAFSVDAGEQGGHHRPHPGPIETPESIAARIRGGEVWIWEVEGRPVHVTAFNPPAYGVARVGPVYTPKDQRGRGYAAAAVARISRALLDTEARVCLFTDQANPTSNALYARLGYLPVGETAGLLIG